MKELPLRKARHIKSDMSMVWMKADSFFIWAGSRSGQFILQLHHELFGVSGLRGDTGWLFGGRTSLCLMIAEPCPRAGSRTQSSGRPGCSQKEKQ